MRRHWSIVCILLLISLGSELGLMPGGVGPKDQPHSTCVVDDDYGGKPSDRDDGRDVPAFDWLVVLPPHVPCPMERTDMILSRKSSDTLLLLRSSGIRRHRRFCVERC